MSGYPRTVKQVKATASAPTLTEGEFGDFSCDLNGNIRVTTSTGSSDAVTIADGADVVEGALADAANTTGTTGTVNGKLRGLVQLLASCISIGSNWMQVSIQNATLAVTQSGLWSFAIAPATTGGWSTFSNTALTSTVVAVKSSAAGQVGGWVFHNPSAATTFVQFFNAATAGAVTIGSTTPTFSFGIAAGASANVEFTAGIAFSSGIQVAATTTATGSTAPATALVAGIFYK